MDESRNKQKYRLTEHDDYWVIPLVGKPVTRIIVGLELTLEFFESDDEQTTIWIGGEFRFEINGKEHTLSTEDPARLGPVLALARSTVESARAYKNGTLEVRFREGGKLSIGPHPQCEAWGVVGSRWLRVVCMPGGELATWQADPPEPSGGSGVTH